MSEFVELQWSSGSIDEARRVARYLVNERLVACVQIIPWIESVYQWNNQLETSQESKVLLKTRRDRAEEVIDVIKTNSSYEVPEILLFEIIGGNQEYLDWLKESCPDVLC
jgi:periplasmic divalent cation tolerance protein